MISPINLNLPLAQALEDFLVECTFLELSNTTLASYWMLHVDGSSNIRGVKARLILTGPDDILAKHALYFIFKTFNIEAKYEVLLTRLRHAQKLGI